MVTGSKTSSLLALRVFVSSTLGLNLKKPKSVSEALGDPSWHQTMEEEFNALLKNKN